VRDDGRAQCWNTRRPGRSGVWRPFGRFVQISAGTAKACGLRPNRSVVCWVFGSAKPAAAPTGSFLQVSVGSGIACGLRTNGAAVCWGSRTKVPSGRFKYVATGDRAVCGVRIDGSIDCWGPRSGDLRKDRPAAKFRWVSVGSRYACGARTSGALVCWGNDFLAAAFGPAGDFTEAKTGSQVTCALRRSRTVLCFSTLGASDSFILSGFLDIDASRQTPGFWCGVHTNGMIECWSQSPSRAPQTSTRRYRAGEFSQVAVGGSGMYCGLTRALTVRCWGLPSAAPSGRFTEVSVGNRFACAVRADRRATCWGANDHGQSRPPQSQRFRRVSVGIDDACGTTATERVVCWGDKHNAATRPPRGRFVDIGLMPFFERGGSEDYGCGLLWTGRITCWGFPAGALKPPVGRFAHWSLGLGTLCGLDEQGGLSCRGTMSFSIPHRP
jgi:Regulator of chromosome condensation (RCC1) repeat